jgi:hypothetical protein
VFPFSAQVLTLTYPDKITRGAAINTIKRWVPDVQPMDNLIREFALKLLRRLQSPGPNSEKMDVDVVVSGVDENMEDGQLPTEALAKTPYLSDALQLPAERGQVLQHLELMFALTVKVPEFLDELVFSLCLMPAHSPPPIHTGYSLRMDRWTFPSRSKSRGSLALSSALWVLRTGNY